MFGKQDGKAPELDVAVSSRVRLARNLKSFSFPVKLGREQANRVLETVKKAVVGNTKLFDGNMMFMDMSGLSPVDKQALVERHLVSPDLVEKQYGAGVLVSRDETVSIMVNEEDHLRIQCLFPGMQVHKAWKLCDHIDDVLEQELGFAYDSELGYLTCCPTNAGTGIRASVMLHLPALAMTGYINRLLEACGKLGVAVRGLYGENTEASGYMFQVSNQVTLGRTEEEITEGICNVAGQIIEQERSLRQELHRQQPYKLEDRIFRSYGIFSNARLISSEESLKLLSDIRLGAAMGIIGRISLELLDELMIMIQAASLQKMAGKLLNPEERDLKRAELIRSKLGSL